MKWFALILIIIALSPAQQAAPACVTSGSDVATSLVTAQADPSRCLELPSGTYAIGAATAGAWLNISADNFELRGAGMGKTILQITAPLTLTSDLVAIRLFGIGQRVRDLTIALGSGHSGAGNLAGINVYGSGVQGSNQGRAERSLIERIEVTGGYTATGAGGYGIGTYRGYVDQGGAQWVTIRDCYVHDSPSTGIGINSNANLILHNHIARVGASFYAHGIYLQGGNNLIEGNTIESVSSWAIHGHKQVPSLDGSGDRIIGNLILNPGSGGIVINSTPNGSNPLVPAGVPLTRYTVIQGNTFRNTAGHRAGAVWCNGVPCVTDGNLLEDMYVTGGGGWIDDSGGGIVSNNILTTLIAPDGAVNYAMIKVSGATGATVSGNRLTNGFYGGGISASGARHTITGNTVLMTGTGSQGLILSGDMLLVTGNRLESTGQAQTMTFNNPVPTNLTLTGNYFRKTGDLWNITLTGVTGQIANNIYDGTPRWNGSGAGVLR